MHSFYSKYAPGDTISLSVDAIADIDPEDRELGMITAVWFSTTGVQYAVTWSDRTEGQHIEEELMLVVPHKEHNKTRKEED